MKPVPPAMQRIRTAVRVIDTVTTTGADVIRLAIPVAKVLVIAARKLRRV